MNKSDIPFLSATELSGLIQSKEVSPVEATEAYLERIDQVDDK
jgi:Asp-tRNA(Asn)/Glu-tRNA(Gln) amidotransferase A subunit family amidase